MVSRLIKFISLEEFNKVIRKEPERKYKLAYALAFGSGLRLSEILGLKENISRCCKAPIEIIRLKKRQKKKICSKCKKELASKDMIRSKTIWRIEPLKQEQVNLEGHQIKIFGKGGKERITVTSPMLNESNIKLLPLKIQRRTLQRRFTELCKKVLKKEFSIHCCRHGFANYMVNEKNVPLPMVQSALGHSNLETTSIYTRSNPKQATDRMWDSF